MLEQLKQLCSHETEEHYIAPFFSLHPGDSKDGLSERLRELRDIGIYRITVEYGAGGTMQLCRFDEDFYAAADQLVEACKELGMQFRLQDAAPFPTGAANGVLAEEQYAHLNKVFIDERHVDVCGPYQGAVIRVSNLMHAVNSEMMRDMSNMSRMDVSDRTQLAVVAYRTLEDGILEDGTGVFLDEYVEDGYLHWNIPEGYWRIFVIFTTGKSSGRRNYMNLLSAESVRLQIEKVHTLIYDHLRDELGKTWIGFFYDEPEIGNSGTGAAYDFHMLPGRRQNNGSDCEVLPWSPEMPQEMEVRDDKWKLHIPYLWYDGQREHAGMRYYYMDAVTCLVRDNYNGQVYPWCAERHIPYMGHVLEDEGSHTRLGCGNGHFFRSEYYQDRAGVDLISAQVMPGSDRRCSWYGAINGDGEFFHYGLAKLASSAARISPVQKGASLCEVFAVYGHMLGPKMSKFLLDHLFVNGINDVIYAGFNRFGIPKAFYKGMDSYCEKMCFLLNHTDSVIKTAVLYHADAEWSGGYAQPFQKAAGELARHQVSYDVIPSDVFRWPSLYDTDISDGLAVNGNRYDALVIPGCDWIDRSVYSFVKKSVETGFPVIFTDRSPVGICGSLEAVDTHCMKVVPLLEIVPALAESIRPDLICEGEHPWIRYAHIKDEEGEYFLIHNEAPKASDDIKLKLDAYRIHVMIKDKMAGDDMPAPGQSPAVLRIDPVTGKKTAVSGCITGDGYLRLTMHLEQYEMGIIYIGNISDDDTTISDAADLPVWKEDRISAWEISAPGAEGPAPWSRLDFSGEICYRSVLVIRPGENVPSVLDLGEVYESCEVLIGDVSAGCRIAPPYRFDVSELLHEGNNEVCVHVWNNPVNHSDSMSFMGLDPDSMSAAPFMIMEPSGMFGPVKWLG